MLKIIFKGITMIILSSSRDSRAVVVFFEDVVG